jgi:hypothetical protein
MSTEPEIEITPDMVEAGSNVIQEHYADHSAAWLAREVFLAMMERARHGRQKPDGQPVIVA